MNDNTMVTVTALGQYAPFMAMLDTHSNTDVRTPVKEGTTNNNLYYSGTPGLLKDTPIILLRTPLYNQDT